MRTSPTNKPQILITMGDPSGIGPEVIMKAMASSRLKGLAVFVLLADKKIIQKYSKKYKFKIAYHSVPNAFGVINLDEKAVNVIDPTEPLKTLKVGTPTKEGAKKALLCIDAAIDLVKNSENTSRMAIVTAPVSKADIASIHPGFIGHTEYLQDAFNAELVTMVLTGEKLTVAPVTRHIPIKDVPRNLSVNLILDTLKQIIKYRQQLTGKKSPVIAVTALNPHCGERGGIGTEESDIIAPAVMKAKKIYKNVEGPISADVVFYKALQGKADIIVSMYHDQALAPFKMIDFDSGVNMTLGLGCIRTSPDHGTAFDIAGKGKANPESMIRAIELAIRAIKQ